MAQVVGWISGRRPRSLLAALALTAATGAAGTEPGIHDFAVLNQRNPVLTAQYWNPILQWLSRKSGVPLRLKIGRTAVETTAAIVRGEASFAYTNHLFTPGRAKLGWRVIARPAGPDLWGEIVVPASSPIQKLADLKRKTVVFPSPEAFAGYWLPMDALAREGVEADAAFAGNQEGAMAQLKSGKATAAGVNGLVMQMYWRREGFPYRVIWKSERFRDMAIMAHPSVAAATVEAVREAMLKMAQDAEGMQVLRQAAALLKQEGELGFVAATDDDYENYRRFFKTTTLSGIEP